MALVVVVTKYTTQILMGGTCCQTYNMQHSYTYYTLMVYCMLLGWMHHLIAAVHNECMQQLMDISPLSVFATVLSAVTADYLCIVLDL